jgi:myo-inositol-1(or 4)-monophosphatase
MSTPDSSTLVDLLNRHELLPLAWRAAGAAGRFLKDERPAGLQVDTKSTPTDVVTAMDRNAELMISTALLGERPTDGLLGEEGGERLGTSDVRWIVARSTAR